MSFNDTILESLINTHRFTLGALIGKLEQDHSQTVSTLSARIEQLSRGNEELTAQLASTRDELETTENLLDEEQEALATARKERATGEASALSTDLCDEIARADSLETQLSTSNVHNHGLQQQLDSMHTSVLAAITALNSGRPADALAALQHYDGV